MKNREVPSSFILAFISTFRPSSSVYMTDKSQQQPCKSNDRQLETLQCRLRDLQKEAAKTDDEYERLKRLKDSHEFRFFPRGPAGFKWRNIIWKRQCECVNCLAVNGWRNAVQDCQVTLSGAEAALKEAEQAQKHSASMTRDDDSTWLDLDDQEDSVCSEKVSDGLTITTGRPGISSLERRDVVDLNTNKSFQPDSSPSNRASENSILETDSRLETSWYSEEVPTSFHRRTEGSIGISGDGACAFGISSL